MNPVAADSACLRSIHHPLPKHPDPLERVFPSFRINRRIEVNVKQHPVIEGQHIETRLNDRVLVGKINLAALLRVVGNERVHPIGDTR
jgi:hypothetical protein